MARRRPRLLAALALFVAACAAPTATSSPTRPGSSPTVPAAATSEAPAATSPSPATPAQTTSLPNVPIGPAAWRVLEPVGAKPAAREDGTWTVAPGTQTAFLFGGRDGSTVFDDLWAFDLANERWMELRPTGEIPRARFGHEAVWVDGIGVVVYAGQAGPKTFFDDLWAYDPDANRWRDLPADGARPKARYGTCAAVGPDGRLWISHGFTEDGTRFADTQAYDFSTGHWSDETPVGRVPVSRCLHGCWWTDDGRFVLYAGQTTGVSALGDVWALADAGTSAAAWTQTAGSLPPERNLYAFARHGDRIVVTGGRGLDGSFLNDTFGLDGETLAAAQIQTDGPTPPGRSGGMVIDDAARGRVILFAGKDGGGAIEDLWELTLP